MRELDLSDKAPWKQRFRADKILWTAIARNNPSRGIACTNRDGIYQLYAWDVETGELTQRTHQPTGVAGGAISADGSHIYFLQDDHGNEIGHFVRVPFEGGDAEDITPDMPPYASFSISQSKSGTVTGFMTAGAGGFDIYVMPQGESPRSIYHSSRMSSGPVLSADGKVAVVDTTERSGTLDNSIMAFDVASGEQIAELWDGEGTSVDAGASSPIMGDPRILAATSKSGFERPLIWNPLTNERHDLPLDSIPGALTASSWSPDAKRLLLQGLHNAEFQLYLYDLEDDSVAKLQHPAGVINGYFTQYGAIYCVWEDSANPSCLIELDNTTGEFKRKVLLSGSVPGGQKWRSITFVGANGDPIQAWLATPEGDGPFPTILETHGGPTSVMVDHFHSASQAWLDHGFAFMSINYHGSITFGKPFEKSIWGNLGQLEVDDMAAAYQWLVDNNIAMPDSVLLTGWSYGGYLTLQALGKRPDLWAGGMGGIAIADWKLMYEDQAETLRGYQRALFGGTPDETPEATRAASPITYAGNVRAPLLVIQGSNDTRCPARQLQAYEEKLKSLGKSITVHWFEAGHGSMATEQQIEHQELMMRFAYQVLG